MAHLAGFVEHGVLLLESEEGLLGQDVRGDEIGDLAAGVGVVRGAVGVENLAEHQHGVSTADGVGAAEDGVQNAVGESALGLASAAQCQKTNVKLIKHKFR